MIIKNSVEYFCCIFLFMLFFKVKGGNDYKYEDVRNKIDIQQIAFIENKGQIVNDSGDVLDNVLFKACSGNLNIYITTTGLSYYIYQAGENKKEETLLHKLFNHKDEEKNKKIKWCRVDMELEGAVIKQNNIVKELPQVAIYNYYLSHCREGIVNVKGYNKVIMKNIYENIDWIIYSNGEGVKHDFIVHPDADPSHIKMIYKGAVEVLKENDHSILLQTELGDIRESKLLCYQNKYQTVDAWFDVVKENKPVNDLNKYYVSIKTESYDKTRDLIIDPALVWSTYFGSGQGPDGAQDIVTDNSGNIYVVGYTGSNNLPVWDQGSGAYYQGVNASASIFGQDAFILKFDNAGVLLWATYYGGLNAESVPGVCVDNSGNVYLSGIAYGLNPIPTFNPLGGAYFKGASSGGEEVFIAKFNVTGALAWSTYYGGSSDDEPNKILVDNNGNIFVVGWTKSTDFTLQNLAGAYNQPSKLGPAATSDGFIIKFNGALQLIWSTYFGGNRDDNFLDAIVDNTGNIYMTGYTASSSATFPLLNWTGAYNQSTKIGATSSTDGFIAKLDPTCNIIWCTYYGGSSDDKANSIALSGSGSIYVIGKTLSTDLPTQNSSPAAYYQLTNAGLWDLFILKFDQTNGSRIWATYYGGSDDDGHLSFYENSRINCIKIDATGKVYVTGLTSSADFPLLDPGCGSFFQGIYASGSLNDADICILSFNTSDSLEWATYYGGSFLEWPTGMAMDNSNNIFITGEFNSTGVSMINPGGGAYYLPSKPGTGTTDDVFIAKFSILPSSTPVVNISGPTTMCVGDSLILTVTGAYSGYLWSNGYTTQSITVINSGSYYVVTTGTCGNDTSTAIAVTVNTNPTVNVSGAAVICPGDTTYITANGTNSYSWSIGETTSIVALSPTTTNTYTVTGIDTNGCFAQSIITIIVNPAPIANAGIDDTICAGENTLLIASGGTGYIWNTGVATQVINVSPLITSIYSVTATNGTCIDIDSVVVNVQAKPVASISKDTTIILGQSLLLSATGGNSYNWFPSEGLSCTNCPSPLASPVTTITYYVIIADENGCTTIDSVLITIQNDDCNANSILIPNAFSPNYDGQNDLLEIKTNCLKTFLFVVYDRWGNKVFESTDINEKWDGTFKGKELDTNVYTYYFSSLLKNNKMITKAGSISLLR